MSGVSAGAGVPGTPTAAQWVEGARPRTLPASISPVIAGSATAHAAGGFDPVPAALALLISIALQIGVNFANDYSDGIRGTDADRVGPLRLVGSGIARPVLVKRAAFACFGVAIGAGAALVLLTLYWWLIPIGIAAILAAWFYTGGNHPYGYHGLGEVFVFVFFGPVAVIGTAVVQVGGVDLATIAAAVAFGLLIVEVLVANNLRDLVGDAATGKRTLATRIGDRNTRLLFAALPAAAAASLLVTAAQTGWWPLLSLLGVGYLTPQVVAVLRGATGRALIPALKGAGLATLLAAAGLALGAVIAGW
jgi:1,4-dihydroxy-2-naphthoate polyprenyltransferase